MTKHKPSDPISLLMTLPGSIPIVELPTLVDWHPVTLGRELGEICMEAGLVRVLLSDGCPHYTLPQNLTLQWVQWPGSFGPWPIGPYIGRSEENERPMWMTRSPISSTVIRTHLPPNAQIVTGPFMLAWSHFDGKGAFLMCPQRTNPLQATCPFCGAGQYTTRENDSGASHDSHAVVPLLLTEAMTTYVCTQCTKSWTTSVGGAQ